MAVPVVGGRVAVVGPVVKLPAVGASGDATCEVGRTHQGREGRSTNISQYVSRLNVCEASRSRGPSRLGVALRIEVSRIVGDDDLFGPDGREGRVGVPTGARVKRGRRYYGVAGIAIVHPADEIMRIGRVVGSCGNPCAKRCIGCNGCASSVGASAKRAACTRAQPVMRGVGIGVFQRNRVLHNREGALQLGGRR